MTNWTLGTKFTALTAHHTCGWHAFNRIVLHCTGFLFLPLVGFTKPKTLLTDSIPFQIKKNLDSGCSEQSSTGDAHVILSFILHDGLVASTCIQALLINGFLIIRKLLFLPCHFIKLVIICITLVDDEYILLF